MPSRPHAPRTPRAIGAISALLLAGCAAWNQPAELRAGPYAALTAGGYAEQFDLPSAVDGESGWILGARGGYRFERFAAVELSYEQVGESDLDLEGTGSIGEVDGYSFVLQGKSYLVDAPLQPYLLAGIGLIDGEVRDSAGLGISDDETETVYKLGGGLEAHSGRNLTFFIEGAWTKPDGDLREFEYVTIVGGVGWRF